MAGMRFGGSDVIISKHGGASPVRLPVAGVQASEEMSAVGTLSCFLDRETLRAAGLPLMLRGRWVRWEDASYGAWAGVVTGSPVVDGVVELTAESGANLLGGELIAEWSEPAAGAAAGLALRALRQAITDKSPGITVGTVDETGIPILLTLGGQDVLADTLPQLTDEGDLEWFVDADFRLHLGSSLGRDIGHRVRLFEGQHIVDYDYSNDLRVADPAEELAISSGISDSLERRSSGGSGGGGNLGRHARRRRRSIHRRAGSGDRWRPGRKRRALRRIGARRMNGPNAANRRKGPGGGAVGGESTDPFVPFETQPMQLWLADRDDCWAHCQIGNTVRVVLDFGYSGQLRILSRAVDTIERTLVIAGEALSDREDER